MVREGATHLILPPEPIVTAAPGETRSELEPQSSVADVYLSPPDTERRFPIFTSAQITLAVIGILLLIIGGIIAWLLWRQEVRERQLFQLPPSTSLGSSPAPSSKPSVDPELILKSADETSPDQLLAAAVRATLTAYNPFGVTRYRYHIADGVVTIEGEAEHAPEKEGAGNVLRLVSGVKRVVNRLQVKNEPGSSTLKVDDAEARRLESALQRHLEAQEEQSRQANVGPAPTRLINSTTEAEVEREAERLRRELALLRQRADDLARRQVAEERLRREADDAARREAEQRTLLEAARTPTAGRRDVPALQAGTIAWSGLIDGADDIRFSGSESTIRHLNGNYPTDVRVSFSAPLPRAASRIALIFSRSRGEIRVVQSPAADNGYTAVVRVDDTRKSGERRYEFTLRWELEEVR